MENKFDDGGPAFPCEYTDYLNSCGGGMTLWDYYASHAIAGMRVENIAAIVVADMAARTADAMLAERKKRMG